MGNYIAGESIEQHAEVEIHQRTILQTTITTKLEEVETDLSDS